MFQVNLKWLFSQNVDIVLLSIVQHLKNWSRKIISKRHIRPNGNHNNYNSLICRIHCHSTVRLIKTENDFFNFSIFNQPATFWGSFLFPSERKPWRLLTLEYIEMSSPLDIILAIATDAKWRTGLRAPRVSKAYSASSHFLCHNKIDSWN